MLFSVVIPTYNRALMLQETLESVFRQRCVDFEVLVVDDGSTDGTAALLARYGDRVRSVSQQNRGPGAARNLGAEHAHGEYLAFLDSDDVWFPWTLDVYSRVINGAAAAPTFVAGKPHLFSSETDLGRATESPLTFTAFPDYYASSDEWRWYSASSFVIRRPAFRAVDGFAPVWINGEDADLAMRLGTSPGFVQVTSPVTFGYREHAASLVSETRRTLEGVQYQVRMEQDERYPGGRARARERQEILTRQARPTILTCLQERRLHDAWDLYRATWSWHFALGRYRFLAAFPILALRAAWRAPRQGGSAA